MDPSRSKLAFAIFGLSLLLALALPWLLRPREPLAALPAEERGALYLRTMANLTTLCVGSRVEGLRDFCREQAELALSLPECDEQCQRVSDAQLPHATK